LLPPLLLAHCDSDVPAILRGEGAAFIRHISGRAFREEVAWRRSKVPVLWMPERLWASADSNAGQRPSRSVMIGRG
jgi:hypothetical protein